MKPMSQKKYAKSTEICPFCRAENSNEYGSYEVFGSNVYQEVTCKVCERSWDDSFMLVGYVPRGDVQS